MFARVTPPWVALALAAVLVAGCGKNAPAPPPTPQIALVANGGGFGDHGFNDSARGALEECGRQTTVVLATAAPTNTAGIEPKLVLFATEKFDTVIGIGYPAAPAMAAAARRFEGTHFVIIDAVVDEPNVESITFDEPQGAFLAGALAALVSKTHRVAFVGGADVPLLERSEAGFTAGAREIDPRVEVENRYLASFTDAAAARAAAGALLSTFSSWSPARRDAARSRPSNGVRMPTRSAPTPIRTDSRRGEFSPASSSTSTSPRYACASRPPGGNRKAGTACLASPTAASA